MDQLLNYIKTTPFYKKLQESLLKENKIELNDTFNDLNIQLIRLIESMTDKNILIVHHNLYHAQKIYDQFSQIDDQVLFYPQDEFITTEMLAMSESLKFERLETVKTILNGKRHKVITHPTGFIKSLLPLKYYKNAELNYKVGDDIDINTFVQTLIAYGYKRANVVEQVGEFSLRGSIIDIFLTDYNEPIRIDLFDTEIDSIRTFSAQTQRSLHKLNAFHVFPRVEFFYDDETFKTIKENVLKTLNNHDFDQETTNRIFQELSDLENHEAIDQLSRYMSFINEPLESLIDYLDQPLVIYMNYPYVKKSVHTIVDDLRDWVLTLNDYPKLGFEFIKDFDRIYQEKAIYLNPLDYVNKAHLTMPLRAKETPLYDNNFHMLVKELKKYDRHTTVLITIQKEKRLNDFINAMDEFVEIKRIGPHDQIFPNRINVTLSSNPLSFEWFDTNLIVLNEDSIYKQSEKKQAKYKSVFKETKKINHIKELRKGDYLVHYEHGIGRFLEIKTMTISDQTNDYIVIQYKGDDTLYIPVENIHLIQKYAAHEGLHPKLNKLGSAEWAKTKQRVRKKAKDIADELIKLYALREQVKGFKYSEDNEFMTQFEADFPYEETPDQLSAIMDVKKDMEDERPMDRLICGDVGYGKTEVALRASFKAALDNKQVAYLAPTTVLARQHYYTFKERLESYGIKCALLNRFVTKAAQTKILEKLKKGDIDIVLGTHRLLSKDVKFKDLGLLIIDEEQRFGVEHKEKIKQLRANIDVLSLSATPIPRTLQMAITGVKQMSLLETPPKNRFPIQTYVLKRNDHVIKDAIERELARNGQIFYLYNRVESIERIQDKLSKLIPDARIVYAHGKMSRLRLEEVIEDFLDYKYDVLVSTTIIETGIDIPNANTLIIHDADQLGLSQLYQIRGRVGRSNRIAYSYLMYKENKQLSDEALKRLQVIKEFTELGSGYKIAVRDLSIRGAGDLLGTEQSGFIDSVGIDLFLEILKEEIDRSKGVLKESQTDQEAIKQKLKVTVNKTIPSDYINDDDLRIDFHKRINKLTSSNELILLKEEMTDRFGKMHEAIELYMIEKLYENLAIHHEVEKVFDKSSKFELIFSEKKSKRINGERLFMVISELSPFIHLAYKKEKIHITIEKFKLNYHYLKALVSILESL
ncbi:MAG: transcription-repair coupling factor [Candidatus Izemoplasmataceae bacterium]